MNRFATAWFAALAAITTLGMSMNAEARLFGLGGTSWKEEVLLHDGSKIIVKRMQTYRGRHEIGQSTPVGEHTIHFELPATGKQVEWTSEYGEDLGRTNFNLLALHILAGTAYLIAEPNLSLSYNKWGRPNPPYVIFKHDGTTWQRIKLSELPREFKTINLIVNNGREEDIVVAAKQLGYVPVEGVSKLNDSLTQPEYKTIVRTPLDHWKPHPPGSNSGRMVRTGDGGWMGMDWFENQPSLEACLKKCAREKVSSQDCPCNQIFKGK
jgi:hypothetical protein